VLLVFTILTTNHLLTQHIQHTQATGATAVLLGNVFLSSTLPMAPGSNGSSSPEVRRPLSFFAPDTR
jgi:hypothetical protein